MQNAAVSLTGWRQSRVRFGRAFEEKLRLLGGSDNWDGDRIADHKDTEVARLVDHAYRTTRYYRRIMDERGLTASDIRGVADLPKQPVLRKRDIRANFDDLISSTVDRRRLRGIRTSGTTGSPTELLTTADALAFKWAVWWRHRGRFGVTRGTPHVKFMTKPLVEPRREQPPYWRWNRPERQAAVPMQQIIRAKVGEIAAFLDREPFAFYSAYPSILHSLAILAMERGIELSNGPTMVFSGAERMFADQQADIKRVTGGTVSQLYGFNEGAGNAAMCEESRLHEDFEFGHLECADPEVDPETGYVKGTIVATGFSNLAFPLIRYSVGDVGSWYPGDYRCPCGRESAVIDSIVGRWDDYVVTPEGHRIRRLGEVFGQVPELKQFQMVQSEPGSVLLRLVVADSFTSDHEHALRHRVGLWLSSSLDVHFEYVDAIEPGTGGKYHRIVNQTGV